MKFFFTLHAPFLWALIDHKGEVTGQGEVAQLSDLQVPGTAQQVVAIAPGESITLRRTLLPGKRRASALAAMPYALEESLTQDVEDLHFTLVDWQSGQPATVAIVAKTQMRHWLDACAEAGIAVDQILPGYLLLPRHGDDSVTISPVEGEASGTVYVRSDRLQGFAIDRDYLDYWLESDVGQDQAIAVTRRELAQQIDQHGPQKVSFWDIGQNPLRWLQSGGASAMPAEMLLLHGEFVPEHRARSYRPLKVAALCSAVAAIAYFASMTLETRQLEARQQQINSEMRSVFQRSFPDQPWLGRPRSQIEGLLSGARDDGETHRFQQLLTAATEVAGQHDAEIEELNYRDRSLTVLCHVGGLSVLDDIRAALQALPGMSAELMSSGASDNRVTGRFRLRVAG